MTVKICILNKYMTVYIRMFLNFNRIKSQKQYPNCLNLTVFYFVLINIL